MSNLVKKIQSLSFKKTKQPSLLLPEINVEYSFNKCCTNCYDEIRKCSKKTKGVVSVEINSEGNKATVKGRFDAEKLAKRIHKKINKRMEIKSKTFPNAGEGSSSGVEKKEDEDDDDDDDDDDDEIVEEKDDDKDEIVEVKDDDDDA